MDKAKKGYILSASIITIVACVFAVIGGLFCFLVGSFSNETMLKESFIEDAEYTYFEEDGGYYFTYMEEGKEEKITQNDIKMITRFLKYSSYVLGVTVLCTAIAKLVLAIRILVLSNQDKYAKNSIIALLILNLLNFNFLESVLLAFALTKQSNAPLTLNDIPNINME